MSKTSVITSFLFSAYPEFANCEIVAIPAKYDYKPYGWGFQKDSPNLEMFNFYLDEMREKGAMKQIFVKYDPPNQVTIRARLDNVRLG